MAGGNSTYDIFNVYLSKFLASCKLGTGSFAGYVRLGRATDYSPLLMPRSWKSILFPPYAFHQACKGDILPLRFLYHNFLKRMHI